MLMFFRCVAEAVVENGVTLSSQRRSERNPFVSACPAAAHLARRCNGWISDVEQTASQDLHG